MFVIFLLLKIIFSIAVVVFEDKEGEQIVFHDFYSFDVVKNGEYMKKDKTFIIKTNEILEKIDKRMFVLDFKDHKGNDIQVVFSKMPTTPINESLMENYMILYNFCIKNEINLEIKLKEKLND
ncbi:hypothetical protein EHP00_1709 [Ecytonucleospora hepatopenaei]|uniref:Uncharacterized protein n=1 Tax=Ecytonucleospora hepatopenaei TaxID=646526 RepID=A0A1W0E2Q9_9MICR|nr:hypothetical protein EHP00_1709 [Ecytonucleospora hepatopenaei]